VNSAFYPAFSIAQQFHAVNSGHLGIFIEIVRNLMNSEPVARATVT
jgi:hypothetical protein